MADWRPYKIDALSQVLMPRDFEVLESLERYRLLDARLIQELHFPVGPNHHATLSAATRASNRITTRLEKHQLISQIPRRVGGWRGGSTKTVWQLAAAGERLLRARRGEPGRRRYVEPSATFLEHTLDVARIAALVLSAARSGDYEVLTIETEPDCWRSFHTARGPQTLKPDLYIVTADEDLETHSFVEVDRGTEHLPAIIRKCRTYQQHWRTGSEQAALELYPAVVWIAPDERRAAKIAAAIDADIVLTTELFRVTVKDGALALLAPNNQSPVERRNP